MSVFCLSTKEKEYIEALRSEEPIDYHMKRLNRIWNRAHKLTYEYCFCQSKNEMKVFKHKFFDWYDNEYNA